MASAGGAMSDLKARWTLAQQRALACIAEEVREEGAMGSEGGATR